VTTLQQRPSTTSWRKGSALALPKDRTVPRALALGFLDLLRRGHPLATNAALLLFGLITIELCRTGVNEFHHFVHGYSETVFAQLMLYLGAISIIERCPTDKWTLRIIFVIALGARLVCVVAPPFLSTDIYRYIWDGKVQAAGINPFRYIPADSHLAFLRDSAIYPHINRAGTARTIYPPAGQAIFLLITRLHAGVTFMKLAWVCFEALTCVFLLRIFKLLDLKPERVLIYAWHPLCLWEIASSGHIDAATITFLTAAIYTRLKSQSAATGAWLALATLTKLYPAALLPALFQRGKWRMAAVFAATMALGYACYSSVGPGVFGYLPGYVQEEGLDSGARFFLLTLANRTLHATIPMPAYIAAGGIIIAAICIWALRRGTGPHAFILSALVIATILNVFYSPHYPWYFLWLLPYLAIVPWPPAFYLVAAATFLFGTNLGAPGEPMYRLNILLYSGFAFMLACDLLARLSLRLNFRLNQFPNLESPALIDTTTTARNL
jgi:alpha-1,6-mannosyltransferase